MPAAGNSFVSLLVLTATIRKLEDRNHMHLLVRVYREMYSFHQNATQLAFF